MKNYWAILAKKWICFNDNSTEVFFKRRIYICKIYRDSILRKAKRKTDGTKLLSTFFIRESFLTFAKIDIFYENTRSTKKSLGENFSLSLTNFLFFIHFLSKDSSGCRGLCRGSSAGRWWNHVRVRPCRNLLRRPGFRGRLSSRGLAAPPERPPSDGTGQYRCRLLGPNQTSIDSEDLKILALVSQK